MWCKECRQDVPALPSGDRQTLCCPRCGTELRTDIPPSDVEAAADDRLSDYDDWELDEQLRHIQRMLQTANDNTGGLIEEGDGGKKLRFDPPEAGLPARHAPAPKRTEKKTRQVVNTRGGASSFLTWIALALGTTSFVCGGVLLAWSIATGRQELWNVGLPVALVGQIALLVGLVLQIDRLWRDNRESAAKLDDVDEQIHELKTATTLLGVSHDSGAAAFYSHFAGGANAQLLLTDLKGQLDLLAMKIAESDR